MRFYRKDSSSAVVLQWKGLNYPLTEAEIIPNLRHLLGELTERLQRELAQGSERISLAEVTELLEVLYEMTELPEIDK